MIVCSLIEPLEVTPHEGSRLGRYVELRQGTQSISVEVGAVPELVAALCSAAAVSAIALEVGDRRILVPGALELPPGEYRALIVVD